MSKVIFYCIIENNINEVKLFLENWAVVNIEDEDGHCWSPLYCASKNRHTEIVKLLIDHGAKFNA